MKEKSPRQTVCNEAGSTPKKPYCGGKIKRITELEPELAQTAGKGLDVLRCQVCGALYTEASPYAALKR